MGLLACAGQARAQTAGVAAGLADLRLATAVRLALATDPATRAFDVEVTAREGVVRLAPVRGTLPPAAVGVARRVPGVRALAEDAAGEDRPPAPLPVQAGHGPPSPEPVAGPASGAVYHTVTAGETLFRIALRYETTVETLLALNRLPSPDIRVGQRLRVR